MSGSRRWFDYVSDDSSTYAINGDESNIEAINTPGDAAAPTTNAGLPQGVKPRYATYTSTLGRQKRVPVLSPTQYAAMASLFGVPATFPDAVAGEDFVLVRLNPERRLRQPILGIDTGLNDGDTPG